MNYYISDLHLGHKKALEYDDRPFLTVEEQDDIIIKKWNDVVENNDTVYILGDMLWNNDLLYSVVGELKGRKHLILGNHDRVNAAFPKFFKDITMMDRVKDSGYIVTLCHYPIAHFEGADRGWCHLYGHIHKGRDSRPFLEYKQKMLQRDFPYNCYNVGCMLPYMDYQPRPIDWIIREAKKWEENEFKKINGDAPIEEKYKWDMC